MWKYLLRRLLLMIPTLLGITVVCFVIINLAPGSPLEQKIAQIKFGGQVSGSTGGGGDSVVSEEVIEALKVQYGFDKPLPMRYLLWLKNIVTLDFGDSFSYEMPVTELILEKLPISLQFGIASLILVYLICIPLGIAKAVRNGNQFDMISSIVLMVLYSIPPLTLGILLRVYFAGGSFLDIFPLGEAYSDNYFDMTLWEQILDRAHHFVLPLICYVVNSFTVLTFLMKNSLLEEVKLDYVRTARAKGLPERTVIYKHALRNALIPILTGLGGFLTVFFAGSIIIEQMFSLDGMGLLSYKSILARDYNVIMALIFIQSLLAMVGRLISDMTYVLVDPRIDFQ
ncbi:MAG: peptide ABC transporter permease [Bdellovibrionaceae bacterium]|nr:peptide ABC transporter permease [Pseudobdellovibrionaceae bacterium]